MDLLVEVAHPTAGLLKGVDVPFDLLATPHSISRPPPLLGQHTESVLQEDLGCTSQELERLRSSGVIG